VKKIIYMFFIFTLFFYYSCNSMPDDDGASNTSNKPTVTQKLKPSDNSSAAKTSAEDAPPVVVEETFETENDNKAVTEDDSSITAENEKLNEIDVVERAPEEIVTEPPEPAVSVVEAPPAEKEPESVVEAPPVEKEPETPAVSEVQKPPAVSAPPPAPQQTTPQQTAPQQNAPQRTVPPSVQQPPPQQPTIQQPAPQEPPQSAPPPVAAQVPEVPVQEEVTQTSAAPPVEEKPVQVTAEPVEEKPPVENKPSAPSVVTEKKNEPVIPPQSPPVIPVNDEVIYSRTVNASVGQIIEIPFRGTGWVYQGELSAKKGINYDSRRIDPEGQTFIFRAEEAGNYSLKFYKYDFLRDYILNDHVRVIVDKGPQADSSWPSLPKDRERVVALPRWPATLDEAEQRRGGVTPNNTTESGNTDNRAVVVPSNQVQEPQKNTSSPNQGQDSQNNTPGQGQITQNNAPTQDRPPQSTSSTVPPAAPAETPRYDGTSDELLQKAKKAFDEGNVKDAVSLLDQHKIYFPSLGDEAYWLYGQFYEANTPSRDILLALDYYKRLIDEYPQSSRCADARKRIQYLERFYININ